ncbi:MAG TPA: two-component regulator propeller domain-containing protein, partial [Saprospiraceae bacterium]|nr:two-component regulator propeller domain-containing protein [Saprospiraceae bacterium]
KNLACITKTKCEYIPFPEQVFTFNRTLSFASDSVNQIVIRINNGFYSFKSEYKEFKKLIIKNPLGQIDTAIYDVVYVKSEHNFLAISKSYIYRYNKSTNEFIPYINLHKLSSPLWNHMLDPTMVCKEEPKIYGNSYFSFTDNGELYKLDIQTGEEKIIQLNKKIPENNLKDKLFTTALLESNGWLWIGSNDIGLFHYNLLTDEIQQFIHEADNPAGLTSNEIFAILSDENGVVWLASNGYGLIKMEPILPLMEVGSPAAKKSKFTYGGLSKNIRAFLETDDGYWIGTLKGLYAYNTSRNEYSDLYKLIKSEYYLQILSRTLANPEEFYEEIGTLAKDRLGNIWIGTWTGRLFIFNPKSNKRLAWSLPSSSLSLLKMIRDLYFDSKDVMWISTYGEGTYAINIKELDFENPASFQPKLIGYNPKDTASISSNTIFSFSEDADGNIWAGAENGLNKYNYTNKKWTRYYNIPGNMHSLNSNNVRSFALDNSGTLWIGTNGGGLNRYNKKENNFTHFTMKNGLPNDAIYSIICDNNGKLWLGTNYGLCRFDPLNYSCKNFTGKDGIQNYEYNTGAALKLTDGTLLFGGVNGYNIIHPDKIENKKPTVPAVVISSIKIFDKEVPPGDSHFNLAFNENSLTFEFAALSYYRNQDNRYAYKMENIDPDWIYSNTRRLVNYSNIKPGTYVFKVKACNSEGVWNEAGTQVYFTINPPWWESWWFRSLLAALVISGVIWFYNYRTALFRKQKMILEKTVELRTAELREQKEIAEQSEKYKQQFLANMSHEIRTPMNAVMGMTELVLDSELNNKQRNYLEAVKKSSNNLLHIINDILDFSKIEVGKVDLEYIDFSIRDVLEQVKQTLNHKAEEKGLHLITEIDETIPDILVGDPVRLYQVLMNLAGNAVKFTERGSISIDVRCLVSDVYKAGIISLIFCIIDTGIGIPQDKLQTVFESFKQAHSSDSRKYGGTGLGLSISKQLVELMGGQITIESEEEAGTTFSFTIDFKEGSLERLQQRSSAEELDGSILNGLRILLVDDNEYNRIVAKDTLESKAKVEIEEAHNGKEAVDALCKEDYDIVLMDVQMPVMDGYEATKEIRNPLSKVRKHDIPVIALTASVVRSDLDKCRAAGMNDYVLKPFKTAELISAIAKVTNRELIKGKIKKKNEANNKADNARITDLSYLNEFCWDDLSKIQKYISMFLNAAPALIEKINTALAENDCEEIASQVHGFKTKWIMMGMKESQSLAVNIEIQCRKNVFNQELKENIEALLSQINRAMIELNNS